MEEEALAFVHQLVVMLVKVKNSSPPPTVGQLSVDCRPTVDRQSGDSWPTVGQQSSDSWLTVGQLSADSLHVTGLIVWNKINISRHRPCYLLLQSSELNSLEKVLESEPARKRTILKYMKDALLPLVDK